MMAACASGELLAAHITGSALPHYAPAFMPERYEDKEYQRLLENWPAIGNCEISNIKPQTILSRV